jgi:ATP-binding cassette subfamily F protein uup
MAAPLVILQDIHLSFGGTPLLEGADLSISARDRLCLVGRNGSGKSTLLKIVAGMIEPDRGNRTVRQRVSIAYLPQEPDLDGFATTLDYVAAGLDDQRPTSRALGLLAHLGLDGNEDPAILSGGELRRCALAKVLAPEPDVLLLDEPTNHLDLPTIEWLEDELDRLRSALVLISHDRRFLQRLSKKTLWLDRGEVRRLNRGFAEFEGWRDTFLEQEERDRHKLDRKIVAEEHWVRYGVTARRKRNQNRLRGLHALRKDRREHVGPVGNVKMSHSEADLSGKLVLDAEAMSKSFGDRPIIRDGWLRVLRGDRLAIVGPNGSGKTTLLKLFTGTIKPDSGVAIRGSNLQLVTLDQRREKLDPKQSLADALTGGNSDQVMVGGQSRHVMGYMKDFLFSPEQAQTPVGRLSGGERGRLMLARALVTSSNLLVLDEPTNDLDLETLDLLQELLATYVGTVLLVSHDRDFIDRVATSVFAAEGNGKWTEYAGGYSDMIAQRGTTTDPYLTKPAAPKPKRAENSPSRARAQSKRRLGFKEKHALEALPKQIAGLEKMIAALHADLADPDLFKRDPAGFETKATELESVLSNLSKAEDQWLELEALREDLKH